MEAKRLRRSDKGIHSSNKDKKEEKLGKRGTKSSPSSEGTIMLRIYSIIYSLALSLVSLSRS